MRKKAFYSSCALAIVAMVLAGCAASPKKEVNAGPKSVAGTLNNERSQQETAHMQTCQRELDVLKNVNPGQHAQLQTEFSHLMKGAAQYAGLRAQLNTGTQETVDALYRYKVNRLCADITQATLNGLADIGEKSK